jgi:hypothetical protein
MKTCQTVIAVMFALGCIAMPALAQNHGDTGCYYNDASQGCVSNILLSAFNPYCPSTCSVNDSYGCNAVL